jgi:hypothetical protein
MIGRLRAFIDWAEALPERRLLWINLGIACLVFLAHGGALAISASKPTPETEGIATLAAFSLPAASLVILSALAGLMRSDWGPRVLALHGLLLAIGALSGVGWAATLVVAGIPKVNFSWQPGLLSASVWYAFLIFSRFSLPDHLKALPSVRYLPMVALVVVLPVDIGVFLRLLGEMGNIFGD